MKETQVIEIRTLCQAMVLTLALNRFYNSNSVYIDTDFLHSMIGWWLCCPPIKKQFGKLLLICSFWWPTKMSFKVQNAWWRHEMEAFSALLALCVGNSPVTGEFPSQRPVTRSFDVFFELCRNIRLSKQSKRRWLEAPFAVIMTSL